jgi:poly(ADP-ribose) glycohydrolase
MVAKEYILSIDATDYSYGSPETQFRENSIDRELLKAYVGFSGVGDQNKKIVSGNWGCGLFKGNLHLKFLIQWMACALAGKELVYCPFGSKNKIKYDRLFDCVKNRSVQEIYELVRNSRKNKSYEEDIYDYLLREL